MTLICYRLDCDFGYFVMTHAQKGAFTVNFSDPAVVLLCNILAVTALAAGSANGQALKRRGGIINPQLQKIYALPEYKTAYQAAEMTYNSSSPRTYTPYLWDSKKALSWIGYKQSEFGRYTLEFDAFEAQLDAASEDSQVRKNPEKVAQLSQIQDRLTEENLNALNAMVTAVDLGTHFVSNDKQEIADLWVPWRLPEDKQLLDESKMKDVLKFMSNIIKCFYESKNYPVQYAHSSSFSANVPRGADSKPLTNEEALAYWRWNNHGPVDTAIVKLYDSLHKAQQTAEKEGLVK